MKFVEEHFRKHHLLRAPHKWFLAFLVSPIHAAEMHYKRKYHLNFVHAKKLFCFDMILLASIVTLIGLSTFWLTFNPTLGAQVNLEITQATERIVSGNSHSYTVSYQNNSDILLREVTLALELPSSFIEPRVDADTFDPTSNTVTLSDLAPGANGTVTIRGMYFHTPDESTSLTARLSYVREDRPIREERTAKIVTISRDSVLTLELKSPSTILGQGSAPAVFHLTNNGSETLSDISVRSPYSYSNKEFGFEEIFITHLGGDGIPEIWSSDPITLDPGESIELSALILSDIGSDTEEIELQVNPSIILNEQDILQKILKANLAVVHPSVEMQTRWIDANAAQPGKTVDLEVTLGNTGNTPLEALELRVGIPTNIVDLQQLPRLNAGRVTNPNESPYQQIYFVATARHSAALRDLEPGDQRRIVLTIPLRRTIQTHHTHTDLDLELAPQLNAIIPSAPESTYTRAPFSITLPLGTSLGLRSELRYYTNEGDQLGRGPLPPTVGKETKYWAITNISNGSSAVTGLIFTATLPSWARYTGKNSVSHGSGVTFDSNTRQVRWQVPQLPAYGQAGVFIELGITPTEAQRGSTPELLQNIRIEAQDSFINRPISTQSTNLNISLPTDNRAKNKGVVIQ